MSQQDQNTCIDLVQDLNRWLNILLDLDLDETLNVEFDDTLSDRRPILGLTCDIDLDLDVIQRNL